jgi:hypothetical protein
MPVTWFRVFANSDQVPAPEAVARSIRDGFPQMQVKFMADDEGWLEADITDPITGHSWKLRRYCRNADDIRGELQSWAAWIEWQPPSPHQQHLMERIMTAKQVFTFEADEDPTSAPLGLALMQFLAGASDGVYQIDGRGFYAAGGGLLLAESD